jgi:hypothetical protein
MREGDISVTQKGCWKTSTDVIGKITGRRLVVEHKGEGIKSDMGGAAIIRFSGFDCATTLFDSSLLHPKSTQNRKSKLIFACRRVAKKIVSQKSTRDNIFPCLPELINKVSAL